MALRVAIVGCGLIGQKRARVLGEHELVAAVDADARRARELAARHPGCLAAADWRAVVGRGDVDAVVVATTNDMLAAITEAAVRHGKHVLVEKPAGRKATELVP